MTLWPRLRNKLFYLFRRNRLDRELAEEMDFHREMIEAEKIREGLARETAVIMARRQLGNTALAGEYSRDAWIIAWLDTSGRDLRHAWRSLSVRRGSSILTVLVFALGVGLLTAMFALTDPYILRPLPYARPGELAVIEVGAEGLTPGVRMPTVAEWRAQTTLFKGLAAIGGFGTARLRLADGSATFLTRKVTEDFVDVLGIQAPRSRAWDAKAPASEEPVLLTPDGRKTLPAEMLNAGRALPSQEGGTLLIAGSLPDSFLFPEVRSGPAIQGLIPFMPGEVMKVTDVFRNGRVAGGGPSMIARLQPGVTLAAVRSALSRPLPSGRSLDVRVEWLSDRMSRAVRPLALGALGAGMLILLICAGNVANLLIARSQYRTREFATREALGATRLDIGRLWLVELGMITTAAVVLGLVLAEAALTTAGRVIPAQYVTLGTPAITPRVVVFASLAGLLVMAFGLIPAALISRVAPRALFGREAGAGGRRVKTFRFTFAAVQAAFAMILAVGAAMLIQSYVNLMRQDAGYTGTAISVNVSYPFSIRGARIAADIEASLDRLRRIPGVHAAAAVKGNVVKDGQSMKGLIVNGTVVMADATEVTPQFFNAAGMSVLQGRALGDGDQRWKAVVVNQAFARAYWPDSSPLGQVILWNGRPGEVVGVVRNVLDHGLVAPPTSTVYSLMETEDHLSTIRYLLRVTGDPAAYRAHIRLAISGVNGDAIITDMDTIDHRLANTVRDRTFATLILVLFCAAGGSVSVAGLVGIVTFIVARRTREIAIRLALGAEPGHIRSLVVREAVAAALTGGLAGLLVGRWLSTCLKSLVYGLEAGNWTTAFAAAAIMLTLMVAAALLPARRAVSLQPAEALRAE